MGACHTSSLGLIPQIFTVCYRQFFIQLVDAGQSGGNVDLGYGVIGGLVQVLDQSTQAVPVANDQQPLVVQQVRQNLFLPPPDDALIGIRQRLCGRQLVGR